MTSPRTLWFAIQGQNPIGYNLLSTPIQRTIAANQKLVVALPTISDGEAWESFVLSASETNTPSSFVAIARIDPGQTIELTTDAQLALSTIVANPAALPTMSLNPGMRRGVSSLAQVFEYDPTSLAPQNNQTVLGAEVGRWLICGGFSTYVAKTDDPGGCAQDIRSIDESVVTVKPYSCNGSDGEGFRFWLINDGDDAIASGKRVMIAVTLNEMARSGLFEGLLRCVFRGYVNTITGILRTEDSSSEPMTGIDTEVIFENQKTDLILQDDLQPDEAYAIDIYPNFTPEQLDNQILNGSLIKINLGLAVQAGAYVEGGSAKGDQIYPEYDRGIVLPQSVGAKCFKRSGMVSSRSFLAVAPTQVLGLAQNTANQPLYINSNGSVYLKPIDDPKDDTEAIRAKIGTLSGVSSPFPWSNPVTFSAGQGLRVTCNYPSNGSQATVRSNYPDPLIAGNTKAEFNPPFVVLYVRSTVGGVATIKKFDGQLIVNAATQQFNITNWSNGTTIASVPVAADDFSLFAALSATATANGSGTIPAGTIEVCFAYEYDGSQVTSISHDRLDGCLPTRSLTDAEVESAAQYWTEAVPTREDLRDVPEANVIPFQARYVRESQSAWWFHSDSTEAESSRVIRPVWRTANQPGRWIESVSNRLLTPNAIPTGTAGLGDVAIVLKLDTEDPDHGKVYRYESSGWVQVAILRGQRGAAGARGSIIVFTAPPTSSTPGDLNEIGFVLNSDPEYVHNGKVYRKDTNGWTLIGNLRGSGTGSGGDSGGLVLTQGTSTPTIDSNELFLTADSDGSNLYPIVEDADGNTHDIALLDRVQIYTKAQRYEVGDLYNDAVTQSGSTYTIQVDRSNVFAIELDNDNAACVVNVSDANDAQFELYLDWDSNNAPKSLTFSNNFDWIDTAPAPDFEGNGNTQTYVIRAVHTGYRMVCDYRPFTSIAPETKALLDRMTGYYSNIQQARMNELLESIKRAGIGITDNAQLFIFAAPNLADALQNWLQYSALSSSNPIEAWRGITTNAPIFLEAFYNYTNTIGLFATDNDPLSGTDLGVEIVDTVNQATRLQVRNTLGQTAGRVLSRSDITLPQNAVHFKSLWMASTRYRNRINPSTGDQTVKLFANGVEIGSLVEAVNNGGGATQQSGDGPELILGGVRRMTMSNGTIVNAETIVRQYSAVFTSEAELTPFQHEALYRALQVYFAGIEEYA